MASTAVAQQALHIYIKNPLGAIKCTTILISGLSGSKVSKNLTTCPAQDEWAFFVVVKHHNSVTQKMYEYSIKFQQFH